MSGLKIQEYLDSLGHGIRPDIRRMERLMKALGNPEAAFKSVHVTGTNGKGSVSAMLESILRAARYKTGLYTSPHLIDLGERIRVCGRKIPDSAFSRIVADIRGKLRQTGLDREMTYFEVTTAAAFLHFAREEVDVAVVEIGLGGRWDATNVLPKPEICVITNVALDHMEYLGDTVQKIAREKAGILKRGSVCLTGAKGPALSVIRAISKKIGVSCVSGGGIFFSRDVAARAAHALSLEGEYQKANLKMALNAIYLLKKMNWTIAERDILEGLKKVHWPARFDARKLGKIPVIIDGAHNPAAMKALARACKAKSLARKSCLLVFNTLMDKESSSMASILSRNLKFSQVFCPKLATSRSSDPEQIRKMFPPSMKFENYASIQALAKRLAMPGGRKNFSWILATGSLYLAGGLLSALKRRLRKSSFREAFS